MSDRETRTKNLLGGLTFGLFVIALVFFTFGCSKKKSGGSTNPYGSYYGGRSGYGGIGTVSRIGGAMENNGRYSLVLAVATPTNADPYNTSFPANVDGELNVTQPIACPANPAFGLNVGRYKLVPIQSQTANISYDLLSSVALQIQGTNFNVVLTVPYSYFTQTNVCGFQGMIGTLNVETINQAYCGLTTGFTDMVPQNMCR